MAAHAEEVVPYGGRSASAWRGAAGANQWERLDRGGRRPARRVRGWARKVRSCRGAMVSLAAQADGFAQFGL